MTLDSIDLFQLWMSFEEIFFPFVCTQQGHAIITVHYKHEKINFTCFNILSHQKTNHISLFSFATHFFQRNFRYTYSKEIKKQFSRFMRFLLCILPCIIRQKAVFYVSNVSNVVDIWFSFGCPIQITSFHVYREIFISKKFGIF